MKRRKFLERVAVLGAAKFLTPIDLKGFDANDPVTERNSVLKDATHGEMLYNGIQLPKVWPPRYLSPDSQDPMPVPYLEKPPEIVPIDIGRQLFVDDFLIHKTNLKRTYHNAEKYSGNPVFTAETDEELKRESVVYLGHGGVFYDDIDRIFKMYYTAGWRGGLAFATSHDMINWKRPEGPVKDNLLLPAGVRWEGHDLNISGSDNSLWLDLNSIDPKERLKFLTSWYHVPADQRPKGFNHTLHTSAEGTRWSRAVPTGLAADYCSFYYNPFRKRWVFSIKQMRSRGRCRYYSENVDFIKGADWSDSVYWTNADKLDLPEPEGRYPAAGETTQLYSLNAVAYESIMVGMHYIHRGPHNRICEEGKFPKLTDLELGFSRDGFHWDRPDRSGFIKGSRTEGTWDRAYLHSTAGVFAVYKDKLIFSYTGYSGIGHDGSRGMYTGGSMGLAILRRDGFASMDTVDQKGVLTTRPVKFKGKYLFVNVDCPKGELRVEVLDETGTIIQPFSAENCQPIKADNTLQQVIWKDTDNLSSISYRAVRFRFYLTNGKLYSFWVSSDKNGASHGYLGAGGPDYNGVIDKSGAREL